MHPEMIKAHIRMRDTTPAAIADELGISRQAVAAVISGTSMSARIRARICAITEFDEKDLWPEPKARKGAPGIRRERKRRKHGEAA